MITCGDCVGIQQCTDLPHAQLSHLSHSPFINNGLKCMNYPVYTHFFTPSIFRRADAHLSLFFIFLEEQQDLFHSSTFDYITN
jgi:hypothetical protein